MNRIRSLLLASTATLCLPAFAQQPGIAHYENIEDWRTVARLASDVPEAAAVSARFSAFGRAFDLELERNERIEAMLERGATTARAYRGTLRDTPDSWARLVLSAGGVSGLIWDGTTLFGIEPANGTTRIFRADDVIVPAGTMSCGMHSSVETAGEMFAALTLEAPAVARAAGATLNLDLGIVSDPELGALYADPEAEMLARVNNVDGIYSEELGVQLTVQRTDVFNDSATDPFTDTTDAEVLLEELAVFRGDTPEQDAQGLTHLFTGRDLDGTTVGIAYIGSVCAQRSIFDPQGRSFGAGLTQSNFGPAAIILESLIAAHEIGHNFGAPHDGEAGEACAAEPSTGFIMAASLDPTADEFSQCSIDLITANLPGMACLSPLAAVDVSLSGQSAVTSPLTETQFSYTISASNLGLQSAAAPTVQLDFDPAFTVISVAPESGTCGPALSSVSCTLGDIPASATRTIGVVLQANTAGTFAIDGTVTATDDANAGNDSFTDNVTIDPASDLALLGSGMTVIVSETNNLTVTLDNRSGVDANNVTLSGSWSENLEIDSAAFDGSNCNPDSLARQFSCQIGTVAGLSSGQLSLSLRGTETGNEVITINVSALEPDPNAANNSMNLDINVIPAGAPPASSDPVSEDSGGGGGSGVLTLLALFAALRRRLGGFDSHPKANFS